MVRPVRVILLLFYVGAMSVLIMLLSPGEIDLLKVLDLKIFTLEDAFSNQAPKVDITEVLAFEGTVDSIEGQNSDATPPEKSFPEHIESEDKASSKNPILFPEGNQSALDNFFSSLKKLSSSNELVRIFHYGDSQLEGDRVTDYLRNRFQKRFGGCGVGMVPITEINNLRISLRHDYSPNWVKYAIYGADRKQPGHKNYGVLGSYFSMYESAEQFVPGPHKGKVTYARSPNTYKRFNIVEQIKVYYRNVRDSLTMSYQLNGNETQKLTIGPSRELGYRRIAAGGNFQKLDLEFESNGSPDLYGVAFDCNRGIAIDNIAMRGSSGIEFTHINKSFFEEQVKKMNVKLIILQYGVNVIPNVRDDYYFYEYAMAKQLKYLKSLAPDIDILVVGVSDMSRKEGTNFESYPNVALVRDAQKAAAFEAGCAFWDLYEAMGGKNAMVSWVSADPPLGHTDYTHFTPRGARLVAEMLYNEIMYQYDSYKNRVREGI